MTITTKTRIKDPGYVYLGELPFFFDDIIPETEVIIRARYFKRRDGSILIDLADENAWATESIEQLSEQIIAKGELEQLIERYCDEE